MGTTSDYRCMFNPPEVLDQPVVTLATTQRGLWALPKTLIPANFWKVGKIMKLTACIKFITDAGAGNYVFGAGIGVVDAPAVIVVGAAVAGTTAVSGGSIAIMEAYFQARTLGPTGTVGIWGRIYANVGLVASTLQPYNFPTAGTTVVSTLDMTLATSGLTFQCSRSGTGVWTAQCVGGPILEEVCL